MSSAPTWLKSFASHKKPKLAKATPESVPRDSVCAVGEGCDDYMDARLLADAASRDEEMQRKKREARAAAPPEPLRPLKERMREELEKGLKAEIDSR